MQKKIMWVKSFRKKQIMGGDQIDDSLEELTQTHDVIL